MRAPGEASLSRGGRGEVCWTSGRPRLRTGCLWGWEFCGLCLTAGPEALTQPRPPTPDSSGPSALALPLSPHGPENLNQSQRWRPRFLCCATATQALSGAAASRSRAWRCVQEPQEAIRSWPPAPVRLWKPSGPSQGAGPGAPRQGGGGQAEPPSTPVIRGQRSTQEECQCPPCITLSSKMSEWPPEGLWPGHRATL